MLELEKKHVKAYLKDKKEIKVTNKKINENKTNFHRVFNYLANEYFKNLKKEFLNSEIISSCKITEIVLNEIKDYLKSKNVINCENDKVIINYETVTFLTSLNHEYKKFHIINIVIMLTFIISSITLILHILEQMVLKWLIPIAVIVILVLLYFIIRKFAREEKNK